MKRKVYLPWDAAGWRSRTYAPRVTKVHGPVGEKWFVDDVFDSTDATYPCCGYHVCSCERQGQSLWRDDGPDPICTKCDADNVPGHACAPVPPSPWPVGPGYPSWRAAAIPTVLTREMFDRFWKTQGL
jgi:hypothetical protein